MIRSVDKKVFRERDYVKNKHVLLYIRIKSGVIAWRSRDS